MLVLKGDHGRLEGAQEKECAPEDERRPDKRVEPKWGLELRLDDEGERHHHDAEDEDDEDGRTVAAVLGGKIEAADGATLRDVKKAAEKTALAAGRTAAGESGAEGREGEWLVRRATLLGGGVRRPNARPTNRCR